MSRVFKKIIHLSSVHNRFDTRIFTKICQTLTTKYLNVSLVVADGSGHEVKNGITIFDVGTTDGGRLSRFIFTTKRMFEKAKELDADIYHLHDPELIPIGLKLKKLGKKVIMDIHENVALQIKDKKYAPFFFRNIISKLYRIFEIISLKKFDALVLAEKSYVHYYADLNKKITVILNMPDLDALKSFKNIKREKNEIFYIGGISNDRGFDVIIKALKILKIQFPNIKMHYVGPYSKKLVNSADLKGIDKNIKFYGMIPLIKGIEHSMNAKVGISILKPIANYKESYSTKIFEYMALGLPVVTSNFKLYKDIIEKHNCGLCVDPLNPQEIAKKIEFIFKNPIESKKMGLNGIKLTKEKFNWKIEEKKLFALYKNLNF